MVNFRNFALIAILGVFASNAIAAEKIAVVDMAMAIFGSSTAQGKLKEAEQSPDFLGLKAKYESSAADLQAMAKEAESKRLTWSIEDAAEHQKKMNYAKADADLTVKKIQAEQQELQQRIVQELGQVAQQALQEIVSEEGITVLLRSESVLIAAPENNITAKVADRIGQKANAE